MESKTSSEGFSKHTYPFNRSSYQKCFFGARIENVAAKKLFVMKALIPGVQNDGETVRVENLVRKCHRKHVSVESLRKNVKIV